MSPEEFESKLKEIHDGCFMWSLSICGYNETLAEEVLQDSYVKAYRSLEKYKGDSSLKTWMYRIIKNTAIDHFRKTNRRAELFDQAIEDDKKFKSDTKEKRVRSVGDKKAMKHQLAKLSKREREIIELVFYQELSAEEASKIMGITLSSARTYLKRAKQSLKSNITSSRRAQAGPSFEKSLTYLIEAKNEADKKAC